MGNEKKEIECPVCKGKGKIQLPPKPDPIYREHVGRTLPFDFWCDEHKQFVTKSHYPNYPCRKVYPIKKKELSDF